MRSKWKSIVLLVVVILITTTCLVLRKVSAGRQISEPMEAGNIEVPYERTLRYADSSELTKEIISYWATKATEDWIGGEKVGVKNARIVLGNFAAGTRIAEMNAYLMKQRSSGTAGSRWWLNPKGGYNFNTMACTPILYLFGDRPEILYPETKEHLLNNILTIQGDKFTRRVPYLPIQDSENHILMAESSRYLKNQWLRKEGNKLPGFDNKSNGVEVGIIDFLREICEHGMYEFNSDPYLGYSYCSLLNLNEFAESKEIKALTRKILDHINWQYAMASYKFKHFPPYRRKFGNKFKTNLDSDYHTVMLKVWASLYQDTLKFDVNRGQHHALWASLLSYRPSDKVMKWTLEKPEPYFVKIGHGYNSCPEIYSGDRDYLLSAGGANQGKNSLIMPRPICLFLDDEASELKETFHMYGPGNDLLKWNNTGVYKDFACTKGKVQIPKGKVAVAKSGKWSVFNISNHIFLAVYSKPELGIMAIVQSKSGAEALQSILNKNFVEKELETRFNHPNGDMIEYDLNSPNNEWIITQVNHNPVHRRFENWPFFEGDGKRLILK